MDVDRSSLADMKIIAVRIPNNEIRYVFRKWLRAKLASSMQSQNIQGRSIALFKSMVSEPMAGFAEEFGKLVLETVPGQFFGSKEVVYQAYVYAFFTAAAEAMDITPKWEVEVECFAGSGRLDLIAQHARDKHASIQKYKRLTYIKKEKGKGYGESQRIRLTRKAEKALTQIEDRRYRSSIRTHVLELREYGIAFLGPYCGIVGRLLSREPGKEWKVADNYTSGARARGETSWEVWYMF